MVDIAHNPDRTTITLRDYNPRDNCFDTIRLFAAVMVIFSHAFPLTGMDEPLQALSQGQASIGFLSVSIFFLVSGYLIPASLDRGTISRYAKKRSLRILPALAVAVLICAFVLGPQLTTLSMGAYLTHPKTWMFVGNIAFLPVGYSLSGVFTDQPLDAVNGSLWTLKYEVACYFLVPAIFVFKRWQTQLVIFGWIASLAFAAIGFESLGGRGKACTILTD